MRTTGCLLVLAACCIFTGELRAQASNAAEAIPAGNEELPYTQYKGHWWYFDSTGTWLMWSGSKWLEPARNGLYQGTNGWVSPPQTTPHVAAYRGSNYVPAPPPSPRPSTNYNRSNGTGGTRYYGYAGDGYYNRNGNYVSNGFNYGSYGPQAGGNYGYGQGANANGTNSAGGNFIGGRRGVPGTILNGQYIDLPGSNIPAIISSRFGRR